MSSRLAEIAALASRLPGPDLAAVTAAQRHDAQLTKPPGALGRLESLAFWYAGWQGRKPLDKVQILVFAGNHGVAAQGVSAFPAAVTAQMVANFEAGGAAINQLAKANQAELTVVPLQLDRPTADFTVQPAMDADEAAEAIAAGMAAVAPDSNLLAIGEMGIANTTAAAALAAALLGGGGQDWVGRGTGVDAQGLLRKQQVVDAALALHGDLGADPLTALQCLGGRELAAMFGAVLAARQQRIPVLVDGFVASAAIAPLYALNRDGLSHCQAAHRSAEAGHDRLLSALKLEPLLDLQLRLGEASGAALAIALVRAALACHFGMATFQDAGVATGEEREEEIV